MDFMKLATLAINGVSLISKMIGSRDPNAGKAASTFSKGLEVVKTGIEAAKDMAPVVATLGATFGPDKKTVTLDELERIEAQLDASIDDFLLPMKRRGPLPPSDPPRG